MASDPQNHPTVLTSSVEGLLPLDQGICDVLPKGSIVKSIHRHGVSAWSATYKMESEDRSGNHVAYFLKYATGNLAKDQLKGEFTGMSDLHRLAPDLAIKPLAWGPLKASALPSYFLLLEFKNLAPGLPDPAKLGAKLAAMHRKSKSPTGMYGYGVQTFDGARPHAIAWDPSWTSFFTKLLSEAYRQDVETNGVWPELALLFGRVQSHLIPRLIGAVEAQGSVEPCLIHGDLWDGNVASEVETGDPVVFDGAVYYAHNEMELGIWRAERHALRDPVFREEYLRNFEASEPKEEWDDRNRLYSAKTNFMHSACWAGSPARRIAFRDFVYLVQKYVPWDDGSAEWERIRSAQGI